MSATRWEYHTFRFVPSKEWQERSAKCAAHPWELDREFDTWLNAYGSEGWELVRHEGAMWQEIAALFKRPRP